jgi:hypothetical protein
MPEMKHGLTGLYWLLVAVTAVAAATWVVVRVHGAPARAITKGIVSGGVAGVVIFGANETHESLGLIGSIVFGSALAIGAGLVIVALGFAGARCRRRK